MFIAGFKKVRKGSLRILLRDGYYSSAFIEALVAPDRLISQAARLYKDSKRTIAGQVSIGGQDFFLKRYNLRGTVHTIKRCFCPSRPIRVAKTAIHLRNNQVPSPSPVAMIERHRLGIKLETYLLSEFIPAIRIRDLLSSGLTRQERDTIISKVADLIAAMHRANVVHGDLKANNIIIQGPNKGYQPWIVDLDGARIKRWLSQVDRMEDLGRLFNSFLDMMPACQSYRFFHYYLESACIQADKKEKRLLLQGIERVAAMHRRRQQGRRS